MTLYGGLTGTSATFSGQVQGGTLTDGFISISAAQINRTSATVELQYGASGNVRFFGGGSYPITFTASTGAATFSSVLEVNSADLNNIFVTNPTTTGTTTGSGIGFKAYNGTSVTQSAGIILTSSTWSFGTYLANQLSVGSDGTGGLALRTANSAPINFYTGGATAGVSTLRLSIASTGAATFSSDVFLANSSSLRLLGGSLRILNSANSATYGYILSSSAWKGSGNNNPSIAADSGLGINFFTNGSTTEAMSIASDGTKYFGNPTGSRFQMNPSGENLYQYTNSYYIYGLYNDANNLAIESLFSGGINFKTAAQSVSSVPTTGTTRMSITGGGYISFNNVVYGNTVNTSPRTLYIESGTGSLGGISSIRASKKNIQDIQNVDWIYQLNPVTFNYRKKDEDGNYTDESHDELFYGLIAEDTEPIADFLVNYNDKEDGSKEMAGIEYMRLITPMLKAIQEQQAQIEELKAMIAAK
jgi:hypothetical protein